MDRICWTGGVTAQFGMFVGIPMSCTSCCTHYSTFVDVVNLVIVERNLYQDLPKLPVLHSCRQRDLPEDCQLPASDDLINPAAKLNWDASLYLLHSLHNVLPICRMRV
jgi:hypothetical protein